ncbi:hypothetical protein UlMin_010184 [Ulmus minor]
MASAQVLTNSVASSKKQEHLQAGKRRLEEFRKKKAAERAKKTSSTSHTNASEVSLNEKQPLEAEHVRVTETDGIGTSGGHAGAVTEPSLVVIDDYNNSIDYAYESEQSSSNDTRTSASFLMNDYSSFSSDQMQNHANGQEYKIYSDLGFGKSVDVNQIPGTKGKSEFGDHTGGSDRLLYGTLPDWSAALQPQGSQDFNGSTSQHNLDRRDEPQFKEHKIPLKDSTVLNGGSSHVSIARISPQSSIGSVLQSEPVTDNGSRSSSLYEDLIRPTTDRRGVAYEVVQNMHSSTSFSDIISSNTGEKNFSSFAGDFSSLENGAVQTFGSTSFESDFKSYPSHVPEYSVANETNSRRSRPSFLDSLNVSRASVGTPFQQDEHEKDSFKLNGLKSKSTDFLGSSPFQKPSMGSFSKLDSQSPSHAFEPSMASVSDGNLGGQPKLTVNENGMERNSEFYLPKQNEDFSALEQHIEDLTQEKFSLQRALEASRALSESLAAENSSLTESYNQQRGGVEQLKSEMEKLQEGIKALLVELEAVRNEYGNAQLECTAADERAKLLASEVIGLEEKALRLRSSELKLEKQLEKSQAEISSLKKKMSSLEKDRQDLQSTISALQEEKKLMQAKLRKASTSVSSIDLRKSTTDKKEVSTSTDDLENEAIPETSNQEISDAPSSSTLPVDGYSTLEVSPANMPPDQFRMIQNINALISELAMEKEELMQALASESSNSSKLKELNNELSRKLEAQTQRLELLTAQSMVNENIPVRLPDSRDIHDNTRYADEGDEVVERVLGWIMKLFPGGPTRRRTSKLL